VTDVPARLPIRTGWPSWSRLTSLTDQDLEVLSRLVAEGGAHGHHPADVAVVVGPSIDHAPVEATLPLVQVVGQVRPR
jgi:hypothetical protein